VSKEISKQELLILKSILVGKNKDEIIILLNNGKSKYLFPKLEGINYLIREENWDYICDEIESIYLVHSKYPNLTLLEKRVQKKNAKMGFPVKRERLIPKEVKIKGFEKQSIQKVGNNELKSLKTYPKLSIKSPIKIFRYYDLEIICKILNIDLSIIQDLCKKAKINFYFEKKFTYDEWEIISPELEIYRVNLYNEEREKEILAKKRKKSLTYEFIHVVNKTSKDKFDDPIRKDSIQKNSIAGNSFKEILTGMRD
jgi:hypothetical protein